MNKAVFVFLIAVCVAIGGFSAFQLINYYSKDRAAEKDFAALLPVSELPGTADIPFDGDLIEYDYLYSYYEELRQRNGDMVGWLSIPGTRVAYPVMQTKGNPEYYLDRNFEKEYSAAGSLFASAISDVELPSDVVTVYGHRMKTGAMFGSLGDFLSSAFLAEHETIVFDTFAGRGLYRVYAAFTIDVGGDGADSGFAYYDYSEFRGEAEFDRFVEQVRGLAATENPAYRPVYGEKLLLLSTCEYSHEDGRLVIVAVRV